MRQWTDEQRELFETDASGMPVLRKVAVSADAGSGKTSVLVERVSRILSVPRTPQDRVLCVSFTERSAADLKERLAQFSTAEVYTIHGFCARVIKEQGALLGLSPLWAVLDQDESQDLFYGAFQKVFRRNPPESTDFSSDQWFDLCRLLAGALYEEIEALEFEDPAVKTFVGAVVYEYETSKRRRNALDYSDLESLAVKLLERPEVFSVYRKRYRHLFVDEFQDTSAVQCRLVKSLNGDDNSLFVVGDVKQSIYRFRGADVEVFQEFVKTLPVHKRLGYNFRSRPEVIDAVNKICAPVITDYAPMVAGRKHAATTKMDDSARVRRVVFDPQESGLAEAVADTVTNLVISGNSVSDIVLLLPRIRGNEKLLATIRKRGIGIALGGAAGGFLSNQSLRALMSLWIWACEPWQKLRAAEVACLFQDGRADLPEALKKLDAPLCQGRNSEEFLELLEEQFELRRNLGFFYLEFKLFILSQHARGLSPSMIARKFNRFLIEGNDSGAQSLLPPPDNVRGTLRVMTVHASKGLEFPIVILADLEGRKPRVSGPFLKKKSSVFIATRDDAGKLVKTKAFEEAVNDEKRAEVEESSRLLYVALTRAEDALVLVDRAEKTDDESAAPKRSKSAAKPAVTWSSWIRPHFSAQTFVSEQDVVAAAAGDTVREVLAPLFEAKPVYSRARIGVTALSKGQAETEVAHAKQSRKSDNLGLDRRSLGTTVHECLERAQWDRLKALASENKLSLDRFWKWLDSDEGQILFCGAASTELIVHREFAFEWARRFPDRPCEIVTGRVDALVAWPEQQKAWIVDYKVLFGKRDSRAILAEYGPQLSIYAEAIRDLTGYKQVEAYLVDVLGSTGSVWHCFLK